MERPAVFFVSRASRCHGQVKSSQVQISMAAAPAAFGGEIGRARRGATGMAGEP